MKSTHNADTVGARGTPPLHTRLCDVLGIKYPIMLAGMGHSARGLSLPRPPRRLVRGA